MKTLLGIAIAAAALCAGCSGSSNHAAPLPAITVGASPASATAGPASPSSPAASPTVSPSASSSPSLRDGLENVVVTDEVRRALVAAYVANHHYEPSYITGTQPGSVYYAHDPSDGSYYALAAFVVGPGAPEAVGVNMQDGGAVTPFERTATGAWHVYDICSTPEFFAFIGSSLPAGGHC